MAEVNESFLDDTGLSYLANRLATMYQPQEQGKGLSTNDYTTEEKTAVATIENKVDKVEGKGLSKNDYTDTDKGLVDTITDKVDKVEGKGLSTNDYTTEDKTAVQNMSSTINNAIEAALEDITGIDFNFDYDSYGDLPRPGQKGIFYMVPHEGSSAPNVYDEYVWYTKIVDDVDTSDYELVGTTSIDLSGYWNNTNLSAITTARIDEILAS